MIYGAYMGSLAFLDKTGFVPNTVDANFIVPHDGCHASLSENWYVIFFISIFLLFLEMVANFMIMQCVFVLLVLPIICYPCYSSIG